VKPGARRPLPPPDCEAGAGGPVPPPTCEVGVGAARGGDGDPTRFHLGTPPTAETPRASRTERPRAGAGHPNPDPAQISAPIPAPHPRPTPRPANSSAALERHRPSRQLLRLRRMRRARRPILDRRRARPRLRLRGRIRRPAEEVREIEPDAAGTQACRAAAPDRAADLRPHHDRRAAPAGRTASLQRSRDGQPQKGHSARGKAHSLQIFSRPAVTFFVAFRVSKTRCERFTTRS